VDFRDILVVVGALVGVAGLVLNLLSRRAANLAGRREEVKAVRRFVRDRLHVLTELALKDSNASWLLSEVPLLVRPGWIFHHPVELESLTLRWHAVPDPARRNAARVRSSRLLPMLEGGRGRLSYSEAMVEIGGATNLFNGPVYRLEGVNISQDGVILDFTRGRYFEYLDTSEVLAYEAGIIVRDGKTSLHAAKYRNWLADPFDLSKRATSVGVVTLTVRRSNEGCGFYLHQRSDKNVTVGSGQVHVVPAGEFTPADLTQEATKRDLVLWHNVMREYAEEFLSVPESFGQTGKSPDYLKDWPYAELNRARRCGMLRCHVLGIGLDPLTWKPEILTCCVIDSATFDVIFLPSILSSAASEATTTERGTTEGVILSGAHGHGLPFIEDNVVSYVNSEYTRPAGRACLQLAWKHREVLGIAPDKAESLSPDKPTPPDQ
jgi:hypothetical protein